MVMRGRSGAPGRSAARVGSSRSSWMWRIAAAEEIAKCAEDKGLREDYIVPDMTEWETFPRTAVAVGMKAIEQGIARVTMSREDLYTMAEAKIREAREQTHVLMKEGLIPPAPEL